LKTLEKLLLNQKYCNFTANKIT